MFHLLCSTYLTATTSKAERSLHVYVHEFCPCISLRDYYNRFTLRAIIESEMELPETSSQISKEAAWPAPRPRPPPTLRPVTSWISFSVVMNSSRSK